MELNAKKEIGLWKIAVGKKDEADREKRRAPKIRGWREIFGELGERGGKFAD